MDIFSQNVFLPVMLFNLLGKPGACDYQFYFDCETECIQKEKECDGVSDCPDGRDERNCGRCFCPCQTNYKKVYINYVINDIRNRTRVHVWIRTNPKLQNVVGLPPNLNLWYYPSSF